VAFDQDNYSSKMQRKFWLNAVSKKEDLFDLILANRRSLSTFFSIVCVVWCCEK